MKNLHNIDSFGTTNLPHLVNLFKEKLTQVTNSNTVVFATIFMTLLYLCIEDQGAFVSGDHDFSACLLVSVPQSPKRQT